MTRWARSGSTQKHKKMPQDASTWEELSKGLKKSAGSKYSEQNLPTSSNSKFKNKNIKLHIQNESVLNKNLKEGVDNSIILRNKLGGNKLKLKEKRCAFYSNDSEEIGSLDNSIQINDNNNSNDHVPTLKKKMNKKKLKLKKSKEKDVKYKNIGSCSDEMLNEQNILLENSIEMKKHSVEGDLNNTNEQSVVSIKHKNGKGKKRKLSKTENLAEASSYAEKDALHLYKSEEGSPKHERISKKNKYRQRYLKKREKSGILLLPEKTERRLYQIKKRLRQKGTAPEVIKDIIRKERRKAELDFRKTFTKLCFNCRKPGHVLAECPVPSNAVSQEAGVCFKCGSLEHTSSKCGKKVSGYPFARCFICKLEGHISRECPSNKHGIYPKGGACSLCDSINHLRKDCPSSKKKEEESTITLHTIDEGSTIDDEIFDQKEEVVKKKSKKMKIVKF